MKTFTTFLYEGIFEDIEAEGKIKSYIIKHGQKHHIDKIMNTHLSYADKLGIAERGFPEHLDKLVDDKNSEVRGIVASKGQERHLDKLVNDPDWYVRAMVASRGLHKYHEQMIHDPSPDVQIAIASTSNHRDLLKKLADTNTQIAAFTAKRRLADMDEGTLT